MPEPNTDNLTLLESAARAAGGVVCKFFCTITKVWNKPDNAGPVTQADLAVNQMLDKYLRTARPNCGWLSEESEDTSDRQNCKYVFIINPIDGIRAFMDGAKHWGHVLAINCGGAMQVAAVYMPVIDLMFLAKHGKGARVNGHPICVTQRTEANGATALAQKGHLQPKHWPAGMPKVTRYFIYRMCCVAQGRFDAILALRPTWEWDVAAGTFIVTEADGCVTDRDGASLQFNSKYARLNGIVAAVHFDLLAELRGPA